MMSGGRNYSIWNTEMFFFESVRQTWQQRNQQIVEANLLREEADRIQEAGLLCQMEVHRVEQEIQDLTIECKESEDRGDYKTREGDRFQKESLRLKEESERAWAKCVQLRVAACKRDGTIDVVYAHKQADSLWDKVF